MHQCKKGKLYSRLHSSTTKRTQNARFYYGSIAIILLKQYNESTNFKGGIAYV